MQFPSNKAKFEVGATVYFIELRHGKAEVIRGTIDMMHVTYDIRYGEREFFDSDALFHTREEAADNFYKLNQKIGHDTRNDK